jgi:hypothetical protein
MSNIITGNFLWDYSTQNYTFYQISGVELIHELVEVSATLAVLLLAINWGLELWGNAVKLASLLRSNGDLTYFPY